MKKQSRRLALSRETLYALDPGSLANANGGSTPLLTLTLVPEVTALTFTIYKVTGG